MLNDLCNRLLKPSVIIGVGLLGYLWLKDYVEPFVIEVACKELFNCN